MHAHLEEHSLLGLDEADEVAAADMSLYLNRVMQAGNKFDGSAPWGTRTAGT